MERLSAEGKFFHRSCFKCEYCATTLRLSAYAYDIEDGESLHIGHGSNRVCHPFLLPGRNLWALPHPSFHFLYTNLSQPSLSFFLNSETLQSPDFESGGVDVSLTSHTFLPYMRLWRLKGV